MPFRNEEDSGADATYFHAMHRFDQGVLSFTATTTIRHNPNPDSSEVAQFVHRLEVGLGNAGNLRHNLATEPNYPAF